MIFITGYVIEYVYYFVECCGYYGYYVRFSWFADSYFTSKAATSLARHDIGRQNIDASGRIIDAATRCMMERLRTWDLRIKATYDWNLISALNQLQTSKVRLGLSAVIVEKTTYIYRKAHKKGLVRGRYLLY